jgi:flagellar biosynthesis/type III secretory pathway chaperone
MDRLRHILERELVLCLELHELLGREKILLLNRAGAKAGALSRADARANLIAALHDTAAAMDDVARRAGELEREKDALVREFNAGSFIGLFGLAAEPQRAELKALHSKLLSLAGEIKKAGDENRVVISRTLTNIKNAVNFIGGFAAADTYHSNGRLDAGVPPCP